MMLAELSKQCNCKCECGVPWRPNFKHNSLCNLCAESECVNGMCKNIVNSCGTFCDYCRCSGVPGDENCDKLRGACYAHQCLQPNCNNLRQRDDCKYCSDCTCPVLEGKNACSKLRYNCDSHYCHEPDCKNTKDISCNFCTVHGCSQCDNMVQVPCAQNKCSGRLWGCLGLKEHDAKLCAVCTGLASECKHHMYEGRAEHIVYSCTYRCQIDLKHLCHLTTQSCNHNHGCTNMHIIDSGPKGESVLCSSCVTICSVAECKSDHTICKHCCVEDNCSGRKANDTDYCTAHLCSRCKRPHEANPELFDECKYVNDVSRTERPPFWRPSDGNEIEPENVMCVRCKFENHPPLTDEESDEEGLAGFGLF